MAVSGPSALRLEAGPLSAEIVPEIGGGIARFDFAEGRRIVDLFRPWPDGGSTEPGALGLFVLAPWSNRISGGGFSFGGSFHALAPNVAGEPFPLHGDAWQKPWTVAEHDATRARLVRETRDLGSFHYRGELEYVLSAEDLSARLSLTNLGQDPLPFGAGFHPWFPRTPGTRLLAPSRTVWLEDDRHLPAEEIAVARRPDWNFSEPRPLPADRINNAFAGWNRQATIFWDDRGVALDVISRPPVNVYILYSPGSDASFFCFEPVTHTVDAHNLAPGPDAHGLVVLVPGATLTAECRFAVRRLPKA